MTASIAPYDSQERLHISQIVFKRLAVFRSFGAIPFAIGVQVENVAFRQNVVRISVDLRQLEPLACEKLVIFFRSPFTPVSRPRRAASARKESVRILLWNLLANIAAVHGPCSLHPLHYRPRKRPPCFKKGSFSRLPPGPSDARFVACSRASPPVDLRRIHIKRSHGARWASRVD